MSSVDVVKAILNLSLRGLPSKTVNITVICLAGECVNLYNPSIELEWTSDGLLSSVTLTGTDDQGRTRRFRRTFTWENGLLKSVSGWEEVTS